jgi:hypothetical protein
VVLTTEEKLEKATPIAPPGPYSPSERCTRLSPSHAARALSIGSARSEEHDEDFYRLGEHL